MPLLHAKREKIRLQEVGLFGVVHPEVLGKFDITNPVCALELNVEPFCFGQDYRPLPTHLSMPYHARPAACSAAVA